MRRKLLMLGAGFALWAPVVVWGAKPQLMVKRGGGTEQLTAALRQHRQHFQRALWWHAEDGAALAIFEGAMRHFPGAQLWWLAHGRKHKTLDAGLINSQTVARYRMNTVGWREFLREHQQNPSQAPFEMDDELRGDMSNRAVKALVPDLTGRAGGLVKRICGGMWLSDGSFEWEDTLIVATKGGRLGLSLHRPRTVVFDGAAATAAALQADQTFIGLAPGPQEIYQRAQVHLRIKMGDAEKHLMLSGIPTEEQLAALMSQSGASIAEQLRFVFGIAPEALGIPGKIQ